MRNKKKYIILLGMMLVSTGYFISENSLSKAELCAVNDIYNPNVADDLSNASKGTRLAVTSAEAVIGVAIGFINPFAGLEYAL